MVIRYHCFGGVCCLHLQGSPFSLTTLKMEAGGSPQTKLITTQYNITSKETAIFITNAIETTNCALTGLCS